MFRIYNHYISSTVVLLVSIEIAVLMMAFYLGISLRFIDQVDLLSIIFSPLSEKAATFAFIMSFSMAGMGMYQLDVKLSTRTTLFRLMPSMLLGFGLITLAFYVFPDLYFGRGILGIVMLLAFLGILFTRSVFMKWFSLNILEPRALVLGIGQRAKECIDEAKGHKIIGFLALSQEECCVPAAAVIERQGSLAAMVDRYGASEIIIATRDRRGGNFPIQELLECKLGGVRVLDLDAYFEREKGQIRIGSLNPSWLVFGGGFDQSTRRSAIKRIFDLVVSLVLLGVTLPVTLVTVVCIWIEDGFPLFYRQERVGKGGSPFMVLKFRSMKKDAEKSGKPQWASTDDPRTTRTGKIIRKLRIDELPQIFNVLKGEMSFVGPRPERPFFVEQLNKEIPYYNVRHSIKPGITGWAQVRYPYGASVEDAIEKLQYDLYYVKNHSLFLDIIILIDTVEVVVLGKGGR